jgi:hypothetical protein
MYHYYYPTNIVGKYLFQQILFEKFLRSICVLKLCQIIENQIISLSAGLFEEAV